MVSASASLLDLPTCSFSRARTRPVAHETVLRSLSNCRRPVPRCPAPAALGGHHIALTAALAEAPWVDAGAEALDAEAGRRLLEASYDADAAEEPETVPSPSSVALSASSQVRFVSQDLGRLCISQSACPESLAHWLGARHCRVSADMP